MDLRHLRRSTVEIIGNVLSLFFCVVILTIAGRPTQAQRPNPVPTTIDFDDQSASQDFSPYYGVYGGRGPAPPVTISTVTFSDGAGIVKAPSLFSSANPVNNVYGTAVANGTNCLNPAAPTFCFGTITISFHQKTSNISFVLESVLDVSGIPIEVDCNVADNQGGKQSVKLNSSNQSVVHLTGVGLEKVTLTCTFGGPARTMPPYIPSGWKAYIDNVQFTTDVQLLDPVSSGFLDPSASQAAIKKDFNTLAKGGNVVIGAAADGVAQVLVRIPAEHVGDAFDLQLLDENGKPDSVSANGGLFAVGDNPGNAASKLTVPVMDTNQGPMAFAVYLAPLDFYRSSADDGSASRQLNVQVQSTGASQSQNKQEVPLTLMRPPVFLVHGLWGDTHDWDTFKDLTNSAIYDRYIGRADYKNSNSESIGANASRVIVQLRNFIRDYAAARNIAAVQADVIGHSMGGLVARYLPVLGGFQRADNYGSGPVHKLITIGTPHLGTPLAAELLKTQNVCSKAILASQGMHVGRGAVDDLKGSGDGGTYSLAIGLAKGSYRPFPIAYLGGASDDSNWPDAFGLIPLALKDFCRLGMPAPPIDTIVTALSKTGWPQIFNNVPNDSLVPVTSQFNGNFSGTSVNGILHDAGIEMLGFSGPVELEPAGNLGKSTLNLLNGPTTTIGFYRAGTD